MNKDSLLALKAQFLTVDFLASLEDADPFTGELLGKELEIIDPGFYYHEKFTDYNGKQKLMVKTARTNKVNHWFADTFLKRMVVKSVEPGIADVVAGTTLAQCVSADLIPTRFKVVGFVPGFDHNGYPSYRRDAISGVKVQKLLGDAFEAYRSTESSPAKKEAYRTIAQNIEDLFLDNLCTKKNGPLTEANEVKYRLGSIEIHVLKMDSLV